MKSVLIPEFMANSILTRTDQRLTVEDPLFTHWASVEMPNNSWFQVDTCFVKDKNEIWKTYIFSELSLALSFTKSIKENLWTVLHIYSRKLCTDSNSKLHEIVEKVVVCKDGNHILFTQAGIIMYETTVELGIQESFIPAKEVFDCSDYFSTSS